MPKVDTSKMTIDEIRALYEAEADAHDDDVAKAKESEDAIKAEQDKLNKELAKARIEKAKTGVEVDEDGEEDKPKEYTPDELAKLMLDKNDKNLY